MALNSMLMSSGTNNLIAMKKRRVDRSGYSEDVETWGLDKKVRCRSRLDLKDRNERYSVLCLSPFSSYCFRTMQLHPLPLLQPVLLPAQVEHPEV